MCSYNILLSEIYCRWLLVITTISYTISAAVKQLGAILPIWYWCFERLSLHCLLTLHNEYSSGLDNIYILCRTFTIYIANDCLLYLKIYSKPNKLIWPKYRIKIIHVMSPFYAKLYLVNIINIIFGCSEMECVTLTIFISFIRNNSLFFTRPEDINAVYDRSRP